MPNRQARRAAGRSGNHQGGSQSRSGFTQFARERPLVVVGLGIFAGMALGALLPWNAIDEEYLGEQAGKLKDSALDLASDGYDKVKSAAQTAYGAAADTLRGGKNGLGENGGTASSGENKTYGTTSHS
jgi:hypothetical protein